MVLSLQLISHKIGIIMLSFTLFVTLRALRFSCNNSHSSNLFQTLSVFTALSSPVVIPRLRASALLEIAVLFTYDSNIVVNVKTCIIT